MTILDKIIQTKRTEIEKSRAAEPLADVKRRAIDQPEPRDFHKAVTGRTTKRINLIAEVKKASPSAGVIRNDFDPVVIGKAYENAGADALSVLTDESYFHGHLSFVQRVRDIVKVPVLRKDFIVDEYQVWQSRAAGADAILLIAECLDTKQMQDLQAVAAELKMTTLIEIHDLDNLMRVMEQVIGQPAKPLCLLGINNRDLRTFKTDLGTTLRMAELVDDREILVSESGIHNRADIDKLVEAGVRAVLVGESLMRAEDVKTKITSLFY